MAQSQRYPFYQVSGTPHELGRQHGEACREQIGQFLEHSYRSIGEYKQQDRATLRARAESFVPSIKGFIPDAIAEMEGIAAGANVSFAEIVLLNVRTELTLGDAGLSDGCSSIGFLTSRTDNDSTIIAQNQDVSDWMTDVGAVLRVAPRDKPAFIMFTWAGVIGYPGFNEHGVAFVQNQLYTEGWRVGVSHYPLKRRILECRNLAEVLDIMQATTFSSAGNYLMVDGDNRLVDAEIAAPHGIGVVESTDDTLAHTNNILSPELEQFDTYQSQLPDSAPRCARAEQLTSTADRVSANDVMQMMSDHEGYPRSICRHNDGTSESIETVASYVMEPQQGRLHVSYGNPCENGYSAYTL
jgi:isopenicillin-N N-acyltransferase-like protein